MTELSPDIVNIFVKYAESIGYKDPLFTIKSGSQKGDNFMGIILKVQIQDRGTENNLKIIIKIAPTDHLTRSVMNTHAMFAREVWTYKNLISKFKKIKKDSTESMLVLPVCIESCDTNCREWLTLEDVTAKGYMMHRPRLATLDKNHMKTALAALAEFHVLSFVLKEQNSNIFISQINQIRDMMFPWDSPNENFKLYVEQESKRSLEVITNKGHKEKLQKFCNNLYDQ